MHMQVAYHTQQIIQQASLNFFFEIGDEFLGLFPLKLNLMGAIKMKDIFVGYNWLKFYFLRLQKRIAN
jgi:hypothetical protein